MVIVEIVNGPIEPFPSNNDRNQDGAELTFNGRVRDTEHGENITALEYEQYEGMAEAELTQLAEEAMKKCPPYPKGHGSDIVAIKKMMKNDLNI